MFVGFGLWAASTLMFWLGDCRFVLLLGYSEFEPVNKIIMLLVLNAGHLAT